MNFIEIRDAIRTKLGEAAVARGSFRVIGFQERKKSAPETAGALRSVEVFFQRGDFPKTGGSPSGPFRHKMTFSIILTATAAAKADLTVLQNPGSTAEQLAAALAAAKVAANEADDILDTMWSDVFESLMDARNLDFGLDFPLQDRWIDDFQKSDPAERGSFVMITGSASLQCAIDEDVEGESGTAASSGDALTTDLKIDGDTAPAGITAGG